MALPAQAQTRSMEATSLADILERILDKGIVIAGDIKVSLVNVEILTLQIRLVICSVDKAKEMGMDWWTDHPAFGPHQAVPALPDSLSRIEERLSKIEEGLASKPVKG
jgi:hypothetical protein